MYDSRSSTDVGNHLDHCPYDSVRRLFPTDISDEQGKRVYGESVTPEFLPRRTRPCGRHCPALADLSIARGWSRPPEPSTLGSPNRCTARSDSYLGRVLLLGTAADRHASRWSRLADLCGGSDTCLFGGHARYRIAQATC